MTFAHGCIIHSSHIFANISDQERKIAVIDETGIFNHKFPSDNKVVFEDIYMSYEAACQKLDELGYDAVLYIPEQVINNPNIVKMTSRKEMGMLIVGKIESVIEQELKLIDLQFQVLIKIF